MLMLIKSYVLSQMFTTNKSVGVFLEIEQEKELF